MQVLWCRTRRRAVMNDDNSKCCLCSVYVEVSFLSSSWDIPSILGVSVHREMNEEIELIRKILHRKDRLHRFSARCRNLYGWSWKSLASSCITKDKEREMECISRDNEWEIHPYTYISFSLYMYLPPYTICIYIHDSPYTHASAYIYIYIYIGTCTSVLYRPLSLYTFISIEISIDTPPIYSLERREKYPRLLLFPHASWSDSEETKDI